MDQIPTKVKRLNRTHNTVIISLMALWCLYYVIEPKTIGSDQRYNVFILSVPTIAGVIALGIYRYKFLLGHFLSDKNLFFRSFVIFFFLLKGLFISYISFGLFANITWNIINKSIADQNPVEVITCKVTKFKDGRKNNKINFKFQGRSESLGTSNQTMKEFKTQDPADYEMKISVQKGMWNFYIVKEYELIYIR